MNIRAFILFFPCLENGVMTDGLSERNAAPVKSAEAQVPVYKLCPAQPATATSTLLQCLKHGHTNFFKTLRDENNITI